MRKINIAIDGPAGSGKGTVARLVADKLDYTHVDSGVLYRLLTYIAIENNIDVNDDSIVEKLMKMDHDFYINGKKVIYNDRDVTDAIRSKEVNELVSIVAGKSFVREKIVKVLQAIARDKGVVMDGRDIASVVLKDAELKIYLDASFEKRVERRYKEEIGKKMNTTIEEVRDIIASRDYKDSVVNKVLVRDEDSVLVDTTNTTVEEAVQRVLDLARERINNDWGSSSVYW